MQDETETKSLTRWRWWPSWRPTSSVILKNTEAKILDRLQNDVWARFVSLPSNDSIWTLTVTNRNLRKKCSKPVSQTPLVLIHGFAGGVGLWIHNLDHLCQSRAVFAFDLVGFGRSSRPQFPTDPGLAEKLSVVSIEHWRLALGMERMILLGHSLGGYLAASYAIQYPDRVSHLILVDPWGFQPMPVDEGSRSARPGCPRWVEALISIASFFNPLAVIRAAGPWGPKLVNRLRPDVNKKFEDIFDDNTMTEYLYHCNAQTPSGEVGFKAMSVTLGWAKKPMLDRIHLLPSTLPVTLVYGGQSWLNSSTGDRIAELRPNSYTRTLVVEGAAHHVYADQPEQFNKIVRSICDSVD